MEAFIDQLTEGELFIGRGAGKRIENYLHSARHSIRIISPYIVESKFELLNTKQKKGVAVRLLSSYEKRHFQNPENSRFLRMLILQRRHTHAWRNEIRRYLLYIGVSLLISAMLIFGIALWSTTITEFLVLQPSTYLILSMLSLAVMLLVVRKMIGIYTYSYETPFPVKFVTDPMWMKSSERFKYPNNAFFHVKLFLIDEEIAFLGSVNLTEKGIKYNVESCITLTDKRQVADLTAYFDELFEQDYHQTQLDRYGKSLWKKDLSRT